MSLITAKKAGEALGISARAVYALAASGALPSFRPLPGAPWPPGFRDEINAWSFGFLGTWNVIPDGQVIHGAALNGAVCMNPRTAAALRAACPEISHV